MASCQHFFLYKDGSEQGDVQWEEIDIEIKGMDGAQTMQSNIITGTASNRIMSEKLHDPYHFGDEFHTFVLEWTPDRVTWKIDGDTVRNTLASENSQVKDLLEPQSYRFNLWAADIPDWVGEFDPDILPVYQFINWISYSSYTPGEGDNGSDFTFQWRDDFESFDSDRWEKANWTFDDNLVVFSPENVEIVDDMMVLSLTKIESDTEPTDVGIITNSPHHSMKNYQNNINIFPNPATQSVKIIGEEIAEDTVIKIINLNGMVVFEEYMDGNDKLMIDTSSLPGGIYVVKTTSPGKSSYNKLIVK